ncbi:hypothetical protein D3C80_1817000 [compost metagenome]
MHHRFGAGHTEHQVGVALVEKRNEFLALVIVVAFLRPPFQAMGKPASMLLHARTLGNQRFHEVWQVVPVVSTLILEQVVSARLIPRSDLPHDFEVVAKGFCSHWLDGDLCIKGK